MKYKIDIKPLSVNSAFKGQKYKTQAYKDFEKKCLYLLPKLTLPDAPYELRITFGISSSLADLDNPQKCFIDCLQKKYGFNDRDIMKITAIKQLVKKGDEYISFQINTFVHEIYE